LGNHRGNIKPHIAMLKAPYNQRIELTPGHISWRCAVTSVAGAVHARRYTSGIL
jgi:hypothetical protein